MRYRLKPKSVEAFQLPRVDHTVEVPRWLVEAAQKGVVLPADAELTGACYVNVRGKAVIAYPGQWLVRQDDGEIFPMKEDEFEAVYEPEVTLQ